jgi:hyperosmotically inducible periplasmic protein
MTRQKFFGWLGALAVATTMTAACSQSDAGVTTAVKSKLAADDTVKANRIDVDTKDRVVTLSGRVDTAAAKTRAIELARATDGVRDVVDTLVVAPGTAATTGVEEKAREAGRDAGNLMGDAGITAAVKTKMLADDTVGGLKIDVDTADGIVTLKGDVASAVEKRRAIEIAKDTDGVKSVKDELKVTKPKA